MTVVRLLDTRSAAGTLADVGCGTGALWRAAAGRFSRGIGLDAVRYDGLPDDLEFVAADLDQTPFPIAAASVDVTTALEVIEHLENPRAFVRELARITRPGGWVVVTTPNQLSALSLLTLAFKGRHSAFQDSEYPAHRTALLEVDLRRIASECGLRDVAVEFTRQGRVPLTGRHYPRALAHLAPRRLSDNIVLIARR
ncbi:MAG TPA: methyltransferase domain-containing protein [Vicinamibacterales bacterium]|jgi:2-polyprenyl-3-methyl-5-hydroxy-6-metoxy-1,4-benzoquinol methylase